MTYRLIIGVFASCLLVAGTVRAQEIIAPPGANDAPVTSLKVLSKDQFKTFGQILPTMQGIRDALGVGCVYCHTYTAPYNPANDFVSDAKPTKQKAREMLKMVQSINQTIGTQIPPLDKPAAGQSRPTPRQATQVTCVTCHRGVPIPKQLLDIVLETGNSQGREAAVARYRDLRKTFYGAQAYDFTDTTLFVAAQRSNAAGKPDDAIAYAQLNVEFNTKSTRSYQVMSQAYVLKKDTAGAIAAMEKAVAIEPANTGLRNQLNQLKNPGRGRG
jgi:hypothetical protein